MDSMSNNLDTGTSNEINSQSNKPLLWDDAKDIALPRCILPLSPTSHKGSSGRIGVLGGSARYTGAPYYAAMAALQAGADLAYVFCADEAALPIKCYSPELMVVPVYPAKEFDQIVMQQQQNDEANQTNQERSEFLVQRMVQEVVSMMDRMHVLVIGPGLGRCPLVFQATAQIIEEAKRRQLALIVDADALFLLTLPKYQNLLQGYNKAVLTPNQVEYQRLKAVYNDDETFQQAFDQNILVIKGRHDQVVRIGGNNNSRVESGTSSTCLICAEEGGLKRSGGIGDVLAGTLGTCVAWHEILQKQTGSQAPEASSSLSSSDWRLWSCWTACCITKGATKRAFAVKKRAMTAPDILKEIGETVEHMTATSTTST